MFGVFCVRACDFFGCATFLWYVSMFGRVTGFWWWWCLCVCACVHVCTREREVYGVSKPDIFRPVQKAFRCVRKFFGMPERFLVRERSSLLCMGVLSSVCFFWCHASECFFLTDY